MKNHHFAWFSLLLTVCLFLSACSNEPRVYDDPFRQARDGVPFVVGDTVAEFRSTKNVEEEQTTASIAKFNFNTYFNADLSFYLVKVKEMREVVITRGWTDDAGKEQQRDDSYTIFDLSIEKIFYDHPSGTLIEGDTIRASSYYQAERNSVYAPEMKEGANYYVQAVRWDSLEESKSEVVRVLSELTDYSIAYSCYGLMPLLDDGTVQYYWELLPEGKLMEYNEQTTGKIYATLSQDEFEVGLKQIIDTYCRTQK